MSRTSEAGPIRSMQRRHLALIISFILAILSCAAVGWVALRPNPVRFVVTGATNVQVQQIGPGTYMVSYDLAEPGWDTLLDRRLRAARWLPPDFSGAPAQYTIYSYVNMYWFGSIWHEANVQGSTTHASITVRRWLRLRWWQGYTLNF